MNIPGLQALKRDRFFHLLLITGVGLSVFVPFTPHTAGGHRLAHHYYPERFDDAHQRRGAERLF